VGVEGVAKVAEVAGHGVSLLEGGRGQLPEIS